MRDNVKLLNLNAWLKKVYPNGRRKTTWEVLLQTQPRKAKP